MHREFLIDEFVKEARVLGNALILNMLTPQGKQILADFVNNDEIAQYADHITFDMIARGMSMSPTDAQALVDIVLHFVGAARDADGAAIKLRPVDPGDTGRLESIAPLPDKTVYLSSFMDKWGNWRRVHRGTPSSPLMHGGVQGVPCDECDGRGWLGRKDEPIPCGRCRSTGLQIDICAECPGKSCNVCRGKGYLARYQAGGATGKRTDDPRVLFLQKQHQLDAIEARKSSNRAKSHRAERKARKRAKREQRARWGNGGTTFHSF